MPQPLTDVQIFSLALVDLGHSAIASFSEDSKAARIGVLMYEQTVLEMLRDHPWRFAEKRVILTADDTRIPAFEFDHTCPFPSDFVRINKVNDGLTNFKRAGNDLLVDDNNPNLVYTARVPEAQFDPGFVSALIARLTARLCIPITDNASARKDYEAVAANKLADAKITDAQDGVPDPTPIGVLDEARI